MLAHEQFIDEQTDKSVIIHTAIIYILIIIGVGVNCNWKGGEGDTENGKKNDFDMSDGRQIGHIIKELNGAFRMMFISSGTEAGLDEVTLMHGWIMGYLHHNQNREIYQKTIESEFNIRRSTVTTILQLMEKKGYIRREAVAGDARLKRIVLTQQGTKIAVQTKSMIDNMERRLTEGIGEKELAVFFETAEKLLQNMGR